MRILKASILGVFSLTLVVLAAPGAHAIFSPQISNQIAVIKQHVFAARQLNGTGSPRHGITKVFDDKTVTSLMDADRARRQEKTTTGLPAQFFDFSQDSKADVFGDELENYGSSFALLFNLMKIDGEWIWINSCLRNDLMEIEEFRDAVMSEAFRSSLLLNRDQAAILWNDYKTLRTIFNLLKTQYDDSKLFFEPEQPNYYVTHCPLGGFWGEYEKAIEDLERSWNVFTTALGLESFRRFGTLSDDPKENMQACGQTKCWGSIWEMAKANAKIKAKQWIAKNQFKFTLSGGGSGSDTSLVDLFRSEGMGGIGNRLEQQWNIVKGMFGPPLLIFDPNLYFTAAQAVAYGFDIAEADILDDNACAYYEPGQKIWRGCTEKELAEFEEEKCLNCRNKYNTGRTALSVTRDLEKQLQERTALLIQTETTLQFNLEFNSIAQASTVDLDKKLFDINMEIKRASEAFGDRAGKAIPSICKEMRAILLKHCPNKGGDIPACR